MKSDEKYFNFPIDLLEGFLIENTHQEHNFILENILAFAIYELSITLDYNTDISKFKSAAKELDVDLGFPDGLFKRGKELYEHFEYYKQPKTGINCKVFWDYYKNEKSEFDKVCLLAHLALKSNTYNKPYTKMDKFYIYSRMDGKVNSVATVFKKYNFPNPIIIDKLSAEVKRYATHRKWDNIRRQLEEKWHWFIPKHIPQINDKGIMELKQVRTVNYFTQLPQEEFYKVIINEEKKRFDKINKSKNSNIAINLIDEFNNKHK
jgi:hypothetical protein